MDTVLGGAQALALLAVIYLPLERLFPAHDQPVRRKEWGTDMLFFLGQHFLWTAPVVFALVGIVGWTEDLPLAGVRATVAGWPLWVQILAVIALCDVCIYWAHRWSHSNRFLWRFHRVHHTAERLDFLAAYREHPFDNLYTRTVENLPAILLGFPLEVIAGFALFRGLWAVYIHSNTRLDPGPLRFLLGAPRLHHWHHDVGLHSRVNFANLSPLMDLIFGTYHDPGHMPKRYGVHAKISHGYVAQLVEPIVGFRRRTKAGREAPVDGQG